MGWDLPLLCCFPCLPGCMASWAPAVLGGEIGRVLAPLFLFVIISSNDTAGSGVPSSVRGMSHEGWVFVLALGRCIAEALLAGLPQLPWPAGEHLLSLFLL